MVQAKAFLLKPEDHLHGLNLISSTNLDYFQPQHQVGDDYSDYLINHVTVMSGQPQLTNLLPPPWPAVPIWTTSSHSTRWVMTTQVT